jgi:N-terminal acetyltransferase B complex catalytic subunit
MTTTRQFCCDDLFRFSPTNLDVLTETYNIPFYLGYLSRWPNLCTIQENPSFRISSYIIGKAEGNSTEWHGHVSAVTVAPEFRRLGLARTLMGDLERVSDDVYKSYFVDLFVRASNKVAVQMYHSLGYVVYRRILNYYSDEDALDMRKACSHDVDKKSIVPLPHPITIDKMWLIKGPT